MTTKQERQAKRQAEMDKPWTIGAVLKVGMVIFIIIGVIIMSFTHGTGLTDSKTVRLSNEQIGLSPPACINQQPARCEAEKAEAHSEEEGAKTAEAAKEYETRLSETEAQSKPGE